MAIVIWKFSASLASVSVNEPRSLNTIQMMSDGRKPRTPPRWANEPHCTSCSCESGVGGVLRRGGGSGAFGSVMGVPFGEGLGMNHGCRSGGGQPGTYADHAYASAPTHGWQRAGCSLVAI